jgi:hypothetical protein
MELFNRALPRRYADSVVLVNCHREYDGEILFFFCDGDGNLLKNGKICRLTRDGSIIRYRGIKVPKNCKEMVTSTGLLKIVMG